MTDHVRVFLSFLPNKGLDGGAHNTGEQEEGGDQDVKEGQRGKGHSWGQISVLWDVNMNHKRLQDESEDRAAEVRLKSLELDPLTLGLLTFDFLSVNNGRFKEENTATDKRTVLSRVYGAG